jgi:tungstate transport system substrate-binding protein
MAHRRIGLVSILLIVALLVGCATPAAVTPTQAPAEPTAAPAEPTQTSAEPTAAPAEPTQAPAEEPTGEAAELLLATTTSTADSGLLDDILPAFTEEYGATVNVVAVGTGQALQLGRDGNADVLLVHARAQEDAFMDEGHGVRREDVMYNDFIILGPADDPAGISGLTDAGEAMALIAESGSTFVSRGDQSGTHTKELSVWKEAGVEPTGDWYISSGQGMGDVLTMANEQLAYTLSDRATYLAFTQQGIELEILVEGDPVLFNPYGVIAVNPNKGPHIQVDLANQFIDWIVSLPVQEMIAEFGVEEFGQPLFVPDSALWREHAGGETAAGDSDGVAAFAVSGAVSAEWTIEELAALPQVTAERTNREGQTFEHTGPAIVALLEEAGVADAETITLIGSDGYEVEVAWAELSACEDCIVAIEDDGTLRSVLPGFPGNTGVQGIVEIVVN